LTPGKRQKFSGKRQEFPGKRQEFPGKRQVFSGSVRCFPENVRRFPENFGDFPGVPMGKRRPANAGGAYHGHFAPSPTLKKPEKSTIQKLYGGIKFCLLHFVQSMVFCGGYEHNF
jgi:hypothetical protein